MTYEAIKDFKKVKIVGGLSPLEMYGILDALLAGAACFLPGCGTITGGAQGCQYVIGGSICPATPAGPALTRSGGQLPLSGGLLWPDAGAGGRCRVLTLSQPGAVTETPPFSHPTPRSACALQP